MTITLNGTAINRCHILNLAPQEASEIFTMMSGGKTKDIIAQFDYPLTFGYDLIKADDFEILWAIYKTKAAITAAFTDWAGRAVSFVGTMSPPQATFKRILKDGQWLIGQCTFAIDQLIEL